MQIRCLISLIACLLVFQLSGCAWLTEIIVGSALQQEYRDGRADDAQGLTRRDRIARSEEETLRRWDAEHQARQWREETRREAALEENRPWLEFLQRDRGSESESAQLPDG